MQDFLWATFCAFLFAAFAPVILGVGWAIYEGQIRPILIPCVEIEIMADEIMRNHPHDSEQWVGIEEQAAWLRGQSFEQGRWRCVRKIIRARLLAR